MSANSFFPLFFGWYPGANSRMIFTYAATEYAGQRTKYFVLGAWVCELVCFTWHSMLSRSNYIHKNGEQFLHHLILIHILSTFDVIRFCHSFFLGHVVVGCWLFLFDSLDHAFAFAACLHVFSMEPAVVYNIRRWPEHDLTQQTITCTNQKAEKRKWTRGDR